MALSSEDRTEVQLLIMLEVEKILHESSGFAEARRAIDRLRRELEADLLDLQGKREEANVMRKIVPES